MERIIMMIICVYVCVCVCVCVCACIGLWKATEGTPDMTLYGAQVCTLTASKIYKIDRRSYPNL